MSTITYKAARAHGGNLVHAVPVRQSDPSKCGAIALCGKNVNTSRKPVWFLAGAAIVSCKSCSRAMVRMGVENFKKETAL